MTRFRSSGEGYAQACTYLRRRRAALGLLPIRIGAANAAGALAVGACAAYGYAYDYPSSETAQAAAIGKCGGSCKKVVTTDKGCVALAVDGHKPCGPNGFANGPRLGAAQNTAH